MIYNIDKQLILENIVEQSRFMKGVNHGFHDSVLPGKIIQSYSHPEDIKKHYRNKEHAIGQDLGLRLGTMAAAKATLGGVTYAGLQSVLPEDTDQAFSVVPAAAASWLGSNMITKRIPYMHRKVFGTKSIYKQ